MKRHDTPILDRRFVGKGQIIIEEGEFTQEAYLIQSGEVSVYTKKEDGSEVELARLRTGQIVGEMAIIFDGPRSASVKAAEDCTLIIISRIQFQEKIKDSDATIRAIIHMLSQRILESNNSLLNKKSDVEDLKRTSNIIYQNVLEKLPANQKRNFQNTILPRLEELLDAIETFQDRYDQR